MDRDCTGETNRRWSDSWCHPWSCSPRCNQHCHPWRCICRCSESYRTPSGILSGSQFTVQRRKIPWRRYQNSSCPLHVQHCTGSCDRRFRQHDFPCTADTYQCSRRRQCPTGYCGGPQQPSSEYCCQPGIFPGECKLCRYPYLGHPSWSCPSYSK